MLVCHGEAVKLFRRCSDVRGKIGVVVDVWKHYPARPEGAENRACAVRNNEAEGYGMFLHPLFLGGYSEQHEQREKGNPVPCHQRGGVYGRAGGPTASGAGRPCAGVCPPGRSGREGRSQGSRGCGGRRAGPGAGYHSGRRQRRGGRGVHFGQ
ncbi:MAG: family 1 glycosylhydrolase [Oscillibacter sp.]|nr:family 1 glycosylhydrolase [Oscillibacter sp.]